jgi:hypothetical protein
VSGGSWKAPITGSPNEFQLAELPIFGNVEVNTEAMTAILVVSVWTSAARSPHRSHMMSRNVQLPDIVVAF